MHFYGGCESFETDGLKIEGMHNLSVYQKLNFDDGAKAIFDCEEFVGYFGKLNGCEKNAVIHLWTGNIRD